MMKPFKVLLVLACVQSIGFFTWSFLTPSESGSAVFLWFSLPRLALLAALLSLALLSFGTSSWLWRLPKRMEAVLRWLDSWCIGQKRLALALLWLSILPTLILAGVLIVSTTPLVYTAYEHWAPTTFPWIKMLISRFFPLIGWGLLLCFELWVYIFARYRHVLVQRETWSWRQNEGGITGLLILVVTVFHWLILAFQLRFFTNHPAWYWSITAKPFTLRDGLFMLSAVLLLWLIWWVLTRKCWVKTGLALVFLAGCLLQFGLGYVEGGGLRSVRDKYFSTYHSAYPEAASRNNRAILASIRDYETIYGQSSFTNTKPPGLMAFYSGLDRFINGSPSPYSFDERLNRLSWGITYSFPIAAMSLVFLLYRFAKRYLSGPSGFVENISPVLLIVCPNILLLTLFADQAIYPALFLIGAWLAVEVARRQSLIAALFYGAFLYIAVFFAFTMLPLYPFACILLALNYWTERKRIRLSRQAGLLLMMAAGTVVLYLVFLWGLNYDFFPRFAKTVEINHNFDFYLRVKQSLPVGPESFSTRVRQVFGAMWINQLEFASTVGFPLYLLFLIQAIRLVARMIKGLSLKRDVIMGSFLLAFVVLNLAGTAQGEVGRLWMFWLPMVLFFAAFELEKWVQKRPSLLLILLLFQFVTVLLTDHFQDLKM